MKRLLHRISSHQNVKGLHSDHSDGDHDPVPPISNLSRGAQNGGNGSTSRGDEIRRGMTLPVRLVSPSSVSDETAPSKVNGQPANSAGLADNSQPGNMTASVSVTAVSTDEKIWKAVNNPNGNVTKTERVLNKLENDAGAAASASTGIVATFKTIVANEEVQEIGKAILNGVPALMSALEGLSKVHPFAAAAFLPFQFAYKQEMKRHDNERSRISLFEAIKDVMLVTVEMKGVGVTPDDTRQTPDGRPVGTRLAALGQQMKKDIEECYNTLDAMTKQSLIVKFCKASTWNDKLAGLKVRFTTRRQELQFALTLNTATTIQDMSAMLKKMHDEFAKEFQSFKTPQDRKIEAFFKANGGEEAVLGNDAQCALLIKLQNEETSTHNIQSTYAAGPSGHKPQTGGAQEQHKEALAALRKEYRSDVASVIEENMESFAKRLDLSLQLISEDLKNDIHHEGDRVINFLKGGPHLRLRDKIMRQVWKDQGWRGSAKTRTVVLALRDYLVERAEHADLNLRPPPPSSASLSTPDDEDAQDPETAMGVPLPDSWMLQYLQVKRLRNLQQVLDPDTSGFSTISEVNTFTQSRHEGWSLPRWISYWAIGWQIYATKYCTEIDDIFTEMRLIRDKVGIQMPGNKRFLNNYISETWPFVIGLTSGIERFEGADWLADQFKEYIVSEEAAFRSRLETIHYDIDSADTVQEILRGEPIERSIFMLIAIIMRRHLLKMHLCLKTEMNAEELYDDSYTVKFVVEAAWLRYNGLVDFYKNQQIIDLKQNFDWFSCGLFRNYFEWKDWTNDQYYKENQIISYSAISQINTIKAEDLKGILMHEVTPVMFNSRLSAVPTTDAESGGNDRKPQSLVPAGTEPQVLAIDTSLGQSGTQKEADTPSLSEIQEYLSGVWFGFHATEDGDPYTGMFYLKIAAAIRSGHTDLTIEGEGSSFGRSVDTIGSIVEGNATITPAPDGEITVEFKHKFDSEEYSYSGTLAFNQLEIIYGKCHSVDSDDYPDGRFLVKKAPTDSIMCHRPLLPGRLDARELWSFAYDAVVGELHRRKPSLTYFYKRMKMIKRCLELLHSSDEPGEAIELSGLRHAFTVQEYIEIRTLAGWYGRVGDLQPVLYCDSCAELISRSRVLCLECESSKGSAYTVEFDAKEDCISSSNLVARDDLTTPHLPTHLLLKTRDALFLMDYSSVKSKALHCSNLAARFYARAKPAAADAVTVSFSEVQTAFVAVTVEVKVPVDTGNDGAPQVLPPAPGSDVGGDNSKGATRGVDPAIPQAAIESNVDNNAISPQFLQLGTTSDTGGTEGSNSDEIAAKASPPPTDLNNIDQSSQPPTVLRDTGDTPGTDDSFSDPLVTTAASEAPGSDSDSEDDKVEEIITLNCIVCHERVSTPCWYCIDCSQNDAFVCSACETVIEKLFPWDYQNRYRKEALVSNSSAHNVLHLLIRFGKTESPPPEALATDISESARSEQRDLNQRLSEIEQRLILRMDGDKKELQQQVGAVEQRLTRIEALLQALLPSAARVSCNNDRT
ncbi:hypothetical protein B0H17DRAFT_633894 [Mycena rosella]|uniref:Uncharacterized protein n=1 Tax=Mycena rosella TaxID=1033263 RepID=A0AAD7DE64_MYCRO|nr:hypothetical protein B0H17DRAFT_633894 [Mycena rosella]